MEGLKKRLGAQGAVDETLLLRLIKHSLDPHEVLALARKYGFVNRVDVPDNENERGEYECLCSAEKKLQKAFDDDVKLPYCSPVSCLVLKEAIESPIKLQEQLSIIAGYICKLDAKIDDFMSKGVDFEPQQQCLRFAKEYQATLMALATST